MTEQERRLLQLIQARIAKLQPPLAVAYLRRIEVLRQSLSVDEITALIQSGQFDSIFTDRVVDSSEEVVRKALEESMRKGFELSLKDLPNAGILEGVPLRFNMLNPRVVRAIQTLESSALDTLRADVKEVTLQTIEAGLHRGEHPREIARDLRQAIGIAPNQAQYVINARKELETLDRAYLQRRNRDKRFDSLVKKAINDGKPLSATKVDQITAAYNRIWVQENTFVNTRQATVDAYRLARHESVASAVDRGLIDGNRYFKIWVHSPQSKDPRPEHLALDGKRVRWDQPYPTGQMQAGFGEFGCRCGDRFELLPLPKGLLSLG